MKKVLGMCLGLGLPWLSVSGLVVSWLAVWPGAVSATTLSRLAISELSTSSDLIIQATAQEGRSQWMEGTLYTRVTLEIHSVLKGTPEPTMAVLLPGGRDLDRPVPVAVQWPGAPRLEPGEEVLLFLRRGTATSPGASGPYYSIVGFSQGKLAISRAEDGTALVGSPGGVTAGSPGRSLASVEDEIRQALRDRREER